jgi:hypothetical protein
MARSRGLNVMISRSSKWSTLKPLPAQFVSRRLVGEQKCCKCFLRFKRPRRWFYISGSGCCKNRKRKKIGRGREKIG